jgi:nicotinate-nucleotide adenylyltransferase
MTWDLRHCVAIFGGSFDPPHVGHVLGAAFLSQVVGFKRVVILPVGAHAFGKPLTPFAERYELCRIAFSGLAGVEVSDLESRLPKPNYTYATLLALRDEHPDWDMRLVVGTDVLLEKSRWQSFDEICALSPLYVLGRQGFPPQNPAAEPQPFPILPAVSSTEIRRVLQSSRSGARPELLQSWLGPRLLEAIERLGLYLPP